MTVIESWYWEHCEAHLEVVWSWPLPFNDQFLCKETGNKVDLFT